MNIYWDAEKYKQNFGFVHQYGNAVLELLDITPSMSVLDLGCGNGALTAKLQELGTVPLGMDASVQQLEQARILYPQLTFIRGDATDFALETPVDAVFSNAVFHWIDREKQPQMLACIANALKPGGQLVFEMGGHGNNALVHGALEAAFSKRGLAYKMPFYFPSVGEYTPMLEDAGLLVSHGLLFDRPTPLKGEDGLVNWMEMFLKKTFEGMQPELAKELRKEAAESLRPALYRDGTWYCDYVRLRCRAVKK